MRRRRLAVAAAVCVVTWGVAAAFVWQTNAPRHQARGAAGRLRPAGSTKAQPAEPVAGANGNQARWVIDENAKPGTSNWRIADIHKRGEIEGYADRVSVQRDEPLTLYVSTTASSYVIEAYRMGYYGGRGGRLIWQSSAIAGYQQAVGSRDTDTNMVEAGWSPSARFRPTASWPPGDYLLKLVADTGGQTYVPLTLRDDNSSAAYVVQNAVTTWQAYNIWGGRSLYEGREGNGSAFSQRSRIVSFDRPYSFGDGAADFLGNEFPMVSLMESLGLDVTYWTDVDLHERPQLVTQHKGLISLGHDEYWSASMRTAVENARDGGVNLAFLGANAMFRQIRFADSETGSNRRVIGYKSAHEDPYTGVNNREVTVNWREPPVSNPESKVIGDLYECNPVKADMVVADQSAWVFDGTGLRTGDQLLDIVGPEYDRYDPSAPGPDNIQILAHSPVHCGGRSSHSDMTYYTAPSGAGVFATGTNWWISHLVAPCPKGDCPHDSQAVRITQNVLQAFGGGPAGQAHPAESNWRSVLRSSSSRPSSSRPSSSRPTVTVPSDYAPSADESNYQG